MLFRFEYFILYSMNTFESSNGVPALCTGHMFF